MSERDERDEREPDMTVLAEQLDYMGRRTPDVEASELLIQAAQEVRQLEARAEALEKELTAVRVAWKPIDEELHRVRTFNERNLGAVKFGAVKINLDEAGQLSALLDSNSEEGSEAS
jgi:hypothetical protein